MENLYITSQQKRSKTELVLMHIYNLPSIPKIMFDALKLLDDKGTNTSEITKIISKDQGLVTKILTIANSPLFGLQRKVTSIDFAILILGFGELRNLISILSMMESFKNKTDKYMDQKEFWVHSFLTGSAAKRIAEDLKYHNAGEAFIAGFLHDLGISVMHRYLHSNFVSIKEMVEKVGMSYKDAELEVMGMQHEEIGYFLIERWNFPDSLCKAVLNHHTPDDAGEDKTLAAIVHLADCMTEKFMIGNFFYDSKIEIDDETKRILNFRSDEDLQDFVNGYRDLFVSQLEAARYFN